MIQLFFPSKFIKYRLLNFGLLFLRRYKSHTILLVSIQAQASSTVCPSQCPTRCLTQPNAHNPCLSQHSSQVSWFSCAVHHQTTWYSKTKKKQNFFDMQRHKYFHLQQMAIKKRPLSNVDAHLLFIAYCVFILFYFSVYWQLEDRVLMCICNRCCILKFKIIICPCSCTYWKLYWG